jgi:hypothetical protein
MPLPPPVHYQQRRTSGSLEGAAAAVAGTASSSNNAAMGPPHSTRDACESILAAIQRSSHASCEVHEEEDGGVNLDHILSKVPYKDMLKDLFGSNAATTHGYRAPAIPVVSKAYEESYMRQPMHDYERQCVMGANCECNFIGSDGFTAVEFLLPAEASALEARQLAAQQMCVLCHRRLVQSLFYDIIYTGEATLVNFSFSASSRFHPPWADKNMPKPRRFTVQRNHTAVRQHMQPRERVRTRSVPAVPAQRPSGVHAAAQRLSSAQQVFGGAEERRQVHPPALCRGAGFSAGIFALCVCCESWSAMEQPMPVFCAALQKG